MGLARVSIPSSSGHQFTVSWYLLHVECRIALFQSLLHQGISLLGEAIADDLERGIQVSIPSSSGHQFTVHWQGNRRQLSRRVSIPSSSGHQFTAGRSNAGEVRFPAAFQSLLHQGISLLRSRFRSQQARIRFVSIPSSSGHQFTAREQIWAGIKGVIRFNPFFIRASVYCAPSWPWPCRPTGWFQSLLHQGISLLASQKIEREILPCVRFNPFFIRASVYWFPVRQPSSGYGRSFNPFFIRASVY